MSPSLPVLQLVAREALDQAVIGIDCLISARLRQSVTDLSNRADDAIAPLLRAAGMAIDLAGIRDGEDQRAGLRKSIADYVDVPGAPS